MKEKVKKQGFAFKPFSVKQKQVLTWWCPNSPVKDKDGIIADGAIRSGKTLCMSLSYVLWAMESFNQQNFGMAGKTIGSFRRNVLFWLKMMLASRGYSVVDHRSDNLIVVSKGTTTNYFYIFGGKDERSQDLIQGITLAGMFFDEVALMPESFVNQATGRCSVTGSKFWFNCNPDNPRHWFKVNWVDKCKEKNIIYLHFTMDDNLSLSEKIKERYRSMYVGVFFKRYILGLWCVAEGLVYSMFSEERHVKKEHMTGALTYVVSVDYGTVNPFSAGLWAFDGWHSQREAEVYYNSREVGKRVDDEEYYKMLKKLIGNRRVECIIVDPSAASFIEVIKKYNEYSVMGANNDVLDGIRVVTTMLNKDMISVHEDCEDNIKEYGLYVWDEEKGDDVVIKENDHSMDDTRYYCYTFLRRRLRWRY
ncbi:PBSX family phage terminase large subunit [Coprococcus comes]|uniref:PBSX family phage terminase large subunit n=2 Tax=Coprococcus comes TaxID=410072 RepID=A0A3R6JYR2_9FIRM|nr:PBSX family phage terminase large subunit [Coprococcus comes]RHF82065.1 PBSX family phage terminase large subunit [Coprococcus comes]